MSVEMAMQPSWLDALADLVRRRIGFVLPPRSLRGLESAVRHETLLGRGQDPGELVSLLESVPLNDERLQSVVQAVTVNESYFFRDPPAMETLRLELLPRLIERRRSSRTLRIWSAGCAGGEEIYSLAILLREILPNPDAWSLSLVGTDIDEAALSGAREALFGDWSLRVTGDEERARYFTPEGRRFRLRRRFRDLCTFSSDNLTTAHAPAPAPGVFDLILCRNVTIYLTPPSIEALYGRLRRALAPGGMLITGASDVRAPAPFRGQVRSGMVVFELPSADEPRDAAAARLAPPLPVLRAVPSDLEAMAPSPLPAAPALLTPARYPRAIEAQVADQPEADRPSPLASPPAAPREDPTQSPVAPSPDFKEVLDQARELANRGDIDGAILLVNDVLRGAGLEPVLFLWLAILHEANGDAVATQRALERVLYLDPYCAEAQLRLGLTHARHDSVRAARHLRNAVVAAQRADAAGHAFGDLSPNDILALASFHLTRMLKEMRS